MAGNNGSTGNNGTKRTGLRVVGKPFRKVDVTAKCTGELKYADDIVFPRMLLQILKAPFQFEDWLLEIERLQFHRANR